MEIWNAQLFLAVGLLLISLSLAQTGNARDNEYVKQVVELYNENSDYVFQPLHDYPARFVLMEEKTQLMVFLIKETECRKAENIRSVECDFKPLGEIKVCTSYVDEQKNPDNIVCNTLHQNSRTKRSTRRKPCKNIFCRLFRKGPGHGSPIAGGKTPNSGILI